MRLPAVKRRTASAVLLGAVFLFLINLNFFGYLTVFGGILFFSIFEFLSITSKDLSNKRSFFLSVTAVFIYFFSSYCFARRGEINLSLIIFLSLAFSPIFLIKRDKSLENYFAVHKNISFGFAYVLIPLCMLNTLVWRNDRYDSTILVYLLVCVWSSDVGGYLAGATFGKKKIFEFISPKKTWAGFWGGLALSFGSAYIFSIFRTIFSARSLFISAFFIHISTVYGDLFESYIKRVSRVKDSGKIIPGHGGFLDRFDGFFFAVFVMYFLKKYFLLFK